MLTREKIREKLLEKFREYDKKYILSINKRSPNWLRLVKEEIKKVKEIIRLIKKANDFFVEVERSQFNFDSPKEGLKVSFRISSIDSSNGRVYWQANPEIETLTQLEELVLRIEDEIEKWLEYWEEPICGSCPYAEIFEWEKEKK